MIRIEQPDGWILVGHRDHAHLAGKFAGRWGNADFAAPEPRDDVLTGVTHHDDAWAERDAEPLLTREGRPSAFSRELVGTYSAFEEIDLEDYLRVRGNATEAVAKENPFAAIIISMHTVNLLTEQADLRTMNAAQRELHGRFIDRQRARQRELADEVARRGAAAAATVQSENLQRAFEFLQACDSLSLIACVDFAKPLPLRHRHRRRDGTLVTLDCIPVGGGRFRVTPWPFDRDELAFGVPCRRVKGTTFPNLDAFRTAYAAAPVEALAIVIVR